MDKIYAAIDLKSFYASVECVERGLDSLTTNLVVADKSRTEKAICLAVSPSLKNQIPLTSIFYYRFSDSCISSYFTLIRSSFSRSGRLSSHRKITVEAACTRSTGAPEM